MARMVKPIKNNKNEVVKRDRVNKVIDLMKMGYPRYKIVDSLSQLWGCSHRQIDRYISIVKKMMRDSYDQQGVEDYLNQFDLLYEWALLNKDGKLAAHILEQKAKLQGFYKERIDMNLNHKIEEIKITIVR
jgi:hypothetical protein